MKRLLLFIFMMGIIQTVSWGQTCLEIDLEKFSLNDIVLLDAKSDNKIIESLLGKHNGFSRNTYNEYEVYYFKKGIVLSYSSILRIDRVTIYLCNFDYESNSFEPFSGKIRLGITRETTAEELSDKLKQYNPKITYRDDSIGYISANLKEHVIYAYFDNNTHRIEKLIMKKTPCD